MKLYHLLFGIALAMSTIAAFYAIVGLVAIFAASAIAIAVLGAALEASKLVIASFLYQRWHETNIAMKSCFTVALVLLMALTSMGVYGFLSKSHLNQTLEIGDNTLQIEILESRVARQENVIKNHETVLSQLDGAVATLREYDKISGPDGALAVRESQKEERQQRENSINQAADRIDQLRADVAELKQEQLSSEAKLGPIRYIAALFGWQDLEAAVRIVMLIIVFVFDPMAILLLIAANKELMREKRTQEPSLAWSFPKNIKFPAISAKVREKIQFPFIMEKKEAQPVEEVELKLKPVEKPAEMDETVEEHMWSVEKQAKTEETVEKLLPPEETMLESMSRPHEQKDEPEDVAQPQDFEENTEEKNSVPSPDRTKTAWGKKIG